MHELKKIERYLRVNLLGPGPRLIKKNLPGRGLTKVEKHCSRPFSTWAKVRTDSDSLPIVVNIF